MVGILNGIRVVDFGRYIAGPYCAELLSHFGADVIRIEKLEGSEDRYTTPVTDDGQGAMFFQMNTNKRGMTLNPVKTEGREIIGKLVATADVVIANLPLPALKQMGIDYDSLKAIKKDIIFTTMSTFGSVGPYSEKVGFDGIAQAMSGSAYLGGFPGQPIKSFAPYVDYSTAVSCAMGTLAAIMHKQQTGEGQMVEGALLRTALCYNNSTIIEQVLLNVNRKGTGNRAQHIAPSDIYNTQDGAVIIQVVGNGLFERWVRLVGLEEWLEDPRFATDSSRGKHSELISEKASAWCAQRTTQEVVDEMEAARLPVGPVLSPQEVYDDPHVQEMGVFNKVAYPGLPGAAPVAGTPILLSKSPGQINSPPPTLGQHTDEIMKELGYAEDEIKVFREKRII